MKRLMYLTVMVVYVLFMAASCRSGAKQTETDNHDHEHGADTHVHEDAQLHEHTQQEEFVVLDSMAIDSTDAVEHDHDHDHDHEH